MIQKHAFIIVWSLIAAMLAVALWQLSLQPDWSQVVAQDNGSPTRTVHGAWLFLVPAGLAFAAIVLMLSLRFAEGKPEAVQSVQKYSATLLLSVSVIAMVLQGVLLARFSGAPLPYEAISRGALVGLGLLMALFANRMPKLPFVASSLRLVRQDEETGRKLVRMGGICFVLTGLASALAGTFAPMHLMPWLVLSLSLGGTAAVIAYAIWLKHRRAAA